MKIMKKITMMTMVLILVLATAAGCGSGTPSNEKISAEDAQEMIDTGEAAVIDVRTKDEYDSGHIEDAILIPVDTIGDSAPEELTDKEETLIIYCRSGRRSKDAASRLTELGYENVYDLGGINDWPYEIVTE